FDYDVALLGGGGANDITFIGTNPVGGRPTFGPSGSVLIGTESGTSNNVDVFGNFPVNAPAPARTATTAPARGDVPPVPGVPPASPPSEMSSTPTAPTSLSEASPALTTGMPSPTSHAVRRVRHGLHHPGFHRMTPSAVVRHRHGRATVSHPGPAHRPGR